MKLLFIRILFSLLMIGCFILGVMQVDLYAVSIASSMQHRPIWNLALGLFLCSFSICCIFKFWNNVIFSSRSDDDYL